MTVKREERFITLLMFSYIFGVLMFYYILDPLRKGLFLQNFPASQLPYAYFLTAFFAGVLATIAFRVGQRSSAIVLLTGTNILIIGTLFYFRWAMGRDIWYLPYVYFVYVKIVSVLSTTQFWLLAGYIYDNRQAKRIYSLLGAGAAIGALAGSFVPAFLSQRLSTESMIMICILVCTGLVVLSHVAWRYRRTDIEVEKPKNDDPKYQFKDLWTMIFGSRHLLLMVVLIFLTLIASQIADWQVDNAVRAAYAHLPAEEMGRSIAQFSGRLSFVINALSILVQVFVAGYVVRHMGILATITFLPAGLFLSSSAIFLFPSVITAAIARGTDSVARYSINRSGLELLYLPLPPSVRKKLKIFVDVFVDRTGRAVAGVVILLFTSSVLPLGLRGTAAVAAGLTLLSVLICIRLRRTYVNSFREQLTRREIDLGDVSSYVSDPASVKLLVDTLQKDNERQILYSLRLLQSARNVDFSEHLYTLLEHPAASVREEAARTLAALPQDCSGQAERLLDDESPAVRQAAIEYLCAAKNSRLDSLLNDSRFTVKAGAARWAAEHAPAGFAPSRELIDNLTSVDGAAAAALAARLPGREGVELIGHLMKNSSPEVAQAAALAAAKAGHLPLVFTVMDMLSSRRLRKGAREALLLYGERILGALGDVLADSGGDPALRREAAWLLGRIPVKRSADLLLQNIDTEDPELQYLIVKALNRLHDTDPGLIRNRSRIADRVHARARMYYERLSICQALAQGNERSLVLKAVRERLKQDIEIIFRLLALDHPRKEIFFAYNALESKRADRRTAAIEFLDNVLNQKLKLIILPVLEEPSTEALLNRAEQLFGIKPIRREEALRVIASRPDSWLKACAEYEMTRP
jgi:ATP/ADP translocase/HEAT repeat protein